MTHSDEIQKKGPVYLLFVGLCMGAADVVPGVSGGTMAFVLGVYPDLLSAIKSINMDFLRHLARLQFKAALRLVPWRFLLPIGCGIAVSLASLAGLLSHLLKHHEIQLFAFFFGLIVASIVALAARLKWTGPSIVWFLLGTAFAYWLVGLVPANPGQSFPVLFGSGALAICAMILPGISGSFVLLVLGQYQHCVETISSMISAVRHLDFGALIQAIVGTVLPIGLGMIIGIVSFSRFLSWLMSRYHAITVATLIGFMTGSLRRIWPYKEYLEWGIDRHGERVPLQWKNILPVTTDTSLLVALGLFVAGFVAISLVDHIQDRRNPVIRIFGGKSHKPVLA